MPYFRIKGKYSVWFGLSIADSLCSAAPEPQKDAIFHGNNVTKCMKVVTPAACALSRPSKPPCLCKSCRRKSCSCSHQHWEFRTCGLINQWMCSPLLARLLMMGCRFAVMEAVVLTWDEKLPLSLY